MISGKIILKSATKVSLDRRFGEIAKQAPATPPAPAPRFAQQANVTIPFSRQELFGNQRRQDTFVQKRPTAMSIAQRLKKRSISYRLGLGNGGGNFGNRQNQNQQAPRVFQRVGVTGRRRGGASYVFGGQSGMGVRLRGQGRIETRIFRPRTRGYLNNKNISRPTRGRISNNNNNNNNIRQNNQPRRGRGNVSNRGIRGRLSGRGGPAPFRGRGGRGARGGGGGGGRNNNNKNATGSVTKERLDDDLEQYMAHTKLDNDSFEMSAI